jgi:3-phenylpropionate/cinnamic acid dioxygenase small subunit
MDLQDISDRVEINDLLTRYARAVDRKDWALYRTVFTTDARIDYSSAGGAVSGVEEMCGWLDEALAQFPATQHMVSNVRVELDGDTATVEAMFHNPMKMPDGSTWVTGGWYHHRLVRTDDGWRSRELVEESAYFSGMPTDLTSPGN